jgi:hypothetical protein
MSLPTSAFNSDTIDGPRKQHPTERVIENGDPLAHKKAKIATTTRDVRKSSGNKVPTKSAPKPSKIQSTSIEDILEPAPTLRVQPCNPNRILEAADGSDDNDPVLVPLEKDDNMPDPVDIGDGSDDESDNEEEPEDDEAELRKPPILAYIAFQTKSS